MKKTPEERRGKVDEEKIIFRVGRWFWPKLNQLLKLRELKVKKENEKIKIIIIKKRETRLINWSQQVTMNYKI